MYGLMQGQMGEGNHETAKISVISANEPPCYVCNLEYFPIVVFFALTPLSQVRRVHDCLQLVITAVVYHIRIST
jgi:hypothetical protein